MNQEAIIELENIIHNEYKGITGIVMQKNGEKIYENYFNGYTAGDAVHVYSVTKSVFSALIGIAIDKGHIQNVNQKVLDFFPDYSVAEGEHTIQSVTIRQLLTMTAPFKFETEPYEAFFTSENWVNAALDLLGGERNWGEFRYSPIIGAHILSGVLSNAVGQPILDFASEHLFDPMGISVHNVVFHSAEEHLAWSSKGKFDNSWVVDPQGINTASWGLALTPSDMAKIGQLYLDGGMWLGKKIIPAWWIKESTKEQSRWGELSYGYLWWVLDSKSQTCAALGDGGNTIYMDAENQTVISIASLFQPDEESRDSIELIHIMLERILR